MSSKLRTRLGLFAALLPAIGMLSCGGMADEEDSDTETEDAVTTWTPCGTEGQTCSFSGVKAVRYGVDGAYKYLSAKDGVACSNLSFGGDPKVGAQKSCSITDVVWTHCANNNLVCSFEGKRVVRRGANNTFAYRSKEGSAVCDIATFGDPTPGVIDTCDVATIPSSLPAGATAWSSGSSWGGSVPADGVDVTVPAGKTIALDKNVRVRNLQVDGTLVCADKDLTLSAESIMVHGRLQCGTETAPFTKRLTITLTGSDPSKNVMGMGAKVIGIMGGGALELHGAPRKSWVRLNGTARAGVTSITVDADTDWRAGDRIVITSTDFDMNQAEERTITAVSGRTLTLDSALANLHWGQKKTYDSGARTYTLDERAEVGLVSRNIVIQGDDGSTASGFGGHVMSMAGATLKVSNIEATRMGQRGTMGRYPLHWHMAGDVTGQYVKNSSIHHTFNRCITVHGTNNALVQSNLCYDNLGHAIFLEDGVERGNVIEGNLGLLTRRPSDADALLPSDRANRVPDKLGPSTFWISNGDNTVRNNVAAGSDGSGFWYSAHSKPSGLSAGVAMNPTPNKILVKEFSGNVTHSAGGMAMVIGGSTDTGDPGGSFYSPATEALFQGSAYYKTRARGVWAHGTRMRFQDFIIADNARGAFFSYTSSLVNSLIVGESDNTGKPTTALERQVGRSLPNAAGEVAGYVLYDGPTTFQNVHFAGFNRNADSVYLLKNNGAANQTVNSRFEGVTFASDTRRIFPETDAVAGIHGGRISQGLIDVDGNISGRAGSYLLPNIPMNVDSRCTRGDWTSNLWSSCLNRYGTLKFHADYGNGFDNASDDLDVTLKRAEGTGSSGVTMTLSANNVYYQQAAILGRGYRYVVTFPAGNFPDAVRFQSSALSSTDTLFVEIAQAPSAVRATRNGTALPAASSLNDLIAGAANRSFRSGSSLYFKYGPGVEIRVE